MTSPTSSSAYPQTKEPKIDPLFRKWEMKEIVQYTHFTPILLAKLVTSPLEVMKLNMQVNGFTSYPKLFMQILREDGIRFFFAGNLVNSIRYFPYTFATYKFKTFYEDLLIGPGGKKRFKNRWDNDYFEMPHEIRSLIAGGLTGISALAVSHPLDFIRTRLSTDMRMGQAHKKYRNIFHCIARSGIVIEERLSGRGRGFLAFNFFPLFYKGFLWAAIAEVPYRAFFFGGYNVLKFTFKNDTSFLEKWTLAQIAVGFATMMTYPLDTIKRYAMKTGEYQIDGSLPFQYKNTSQYVLTTLHERGISAFYRGLSMNLVRTPLSAFFLASFDFLYHSGDHQMKNNSNFNKSQISNE